MTHMNHVPGSLGCNALIKLHSALKLNPISRIIPADPNDVNFCDFSALLIFKHSNGKKIVSLPFLLVIGLLRREKFKACFLK